MKQPANISKVYNSITANVGKRVQIISNKGRNRYDITEGVISKTYPCVFLIAVEGELAESIKTISYSYTDVLTKDVEVVFAK